MYTIQHNPARLYNCNETGITIVQHKHMKILGLKGKRQVSPIQTAEWGSLVTVIDCMRPAGHVIPPLLIFPRKYMKPEVMNGTLPLWINPCVPSLEVDTERNFRPVVSSFHQTYRADKISSCCGSSGQALFTHEKSGGHYFSSRETC
jgi:hypothetical protein